MSKTNHGRGFVENDRLHRQVREVVEVKQRDPNISRYIGSTVDEEAGTVTTKYLENAPGHYLNGYIRGGKPHGHITKKGRGQSVQSKITGKSYSGIVGWDNSNGHRGEAKAMRGIKQGIHRSLRQHEKQAIAKMVRDGEE